MRDQGNFPALLVAAGLGLLGCASKGSGGAGIDGGGPLGTCPADPRNDDFIADFADDNGIYPADGRSGGFYVYGDTLGAFDPPKMGDAAYPISTTVGNPQCSGPGSFHIKAAGFHEWGAALATDFKPKPDGAIVKDSYDASKYKGISFWAKASNEVSFVQVKFPDINTDTEGKADTDPTHCVLAAGFPNNCSPYLVKLDDPDFLTYTSRIDRSWKQFKIYFADTKQDMFNIGYVPPGDKLDVAHLLGFAIQVNANFGTMPTTSNDFEVWIDDVEFIR